MKTLLLFVRWLCLAAAVCSTALVAFNLAHSEWSLVIWNVALTCTNVWSFNNLGRALSVVSRR